MKLKGLGRRLYNIFFHTHTVAGITISAALFIIFYAGSFALFREEIFRWENPTARGLEPVELEVEKTIAALRAAEPNLDETKNITIRSGHEEMPFGMVFGARTLKDSTNDFFRARVDPAENYTVTIVEEETTTVGNTLYRLHYFGQIPVIGLYLSGLVALFFLFATITGVMIHWRNIVSKFYAFSTRGKWKQIWTNAHTVLGMIGLPFQIVYAVTGAFYGILILLLIPSALILFGGDNNKVIAAVRPAAAITVSDSAAIVDFSGVGALIAEAKARYPDAHLRNVRFQNYGKEDGIMNLYFDDHRTVTGVAEVIYRVHTKEVLFEVGPGKTDYANSVISVIGRLHFATFGGIGLKVIYFILAMITCFMLLSGVLLWQAARNKRSYTDKERRFHHRVTKVNLAVCLSLFPAVATIFLANKLIPFDLPGRTFYVDLAFFSTWLLFILAGLRWNDYRRLNWNFLLLGGSLSILVPIVNGIMTGDWLWNTLAKGWFYVAGVDLFWLIAGLTALVVCSRIDRSEKEVKQVSSERESATTAAEPVAASYLLGNSLKS